MTEAVHAAAILIRMASAEEAGTAGRAEKTAELAKLLNVESAADKQVDTLIYCNLSAKVSLKNLCMRTPGSNPLTEASKVAKEALFARLSLSDCPLQVMEPDYSHLQNFLKAFLFSLSILK